MPPSLILEVLRITEAEMDLRDLTRETEQARLGMKRVDYEDFADTLVGEQIDLTERTEQVVKDILALPDAQADFGKEIQMLRDAAGAMADTEEKLLTPTTGPVTIASETEAIEHLLRARRSGGGGGGGNTPGGGGPRKGQTDVSALALVGRSEDASGVTADREVGAAMVTNEEQQSAELRSSLDRYFEKLNGK